MKTFKSLQALLAISIGFVAGSDASAQAAVEEELLRLAADYTGDPGRNTVVFGVEVGEERFHVISDAGPNAAVQVRPGTSSSEKFHFTFDSNATFSAVASGQMSALTAMGKANESDFAPMDAVFSSAASNQSDAANLFLSVSNHFWAVGQPEIVSLGFDSARTVHGGEAIPIYYAPGTRSAWYGIKPGQHINKDPGDQINTFDTLIIVVKAGDAKARVNGREMSLRDNTSFFIPGGQRHEFWNEGQHPAEFIIFMFGDGA